MSEDSIRQLLKSTGLPEKEIDVYLFLYRHVPLKCEEIARGLRMSRPQVYKLLRNLETRNMLDSTLQHPILYGTISIDSVLDSLIKEKQHDAFLLRNARKEILNHCSAPLKKAQINQPEKFAIIEGKNKICPRILQMVEKAKYKFIMLNNGSDLGKNFQMDFGDTLFRICKRKNVKVSIILQDPSAGGGNGLLGVFQRYAYSEKNHKLSCRLLNTNLKCSMRFLVRDLEEAIFFTAFSDNLFSRSEVAIWTNSTAIMNLLSTLFERLWVDCDSVSVKNFLVRGGFSERSLVEIRKWYEGPAANSHILSELSG
jgi:sugar-specific transcriptional regulator TrmB